LALLALLGGFAAGFGCVAAVLTAVEYLITFQSALGNWSSDWPIFAIIAAILGLSAVAGAVWQLSWVRSHRSDAAKLGMVAGAFSAVVLASLAMLSAWVPQIETVTLIAGRLFVLIGPGIVVALGASTIRPKQLDVAGVGGLTSA
jgi:hypothetical protein